MRAATAVRPWGSLKPSPTACAAVGEATKRIGLRAWGRCEALQAGAHTAGAFEPREVPGLVDDFQPSCSDASRGRRGGLMEGHRAARSRNASERDIDARELPL